MSSGTPVPERPPGPLSFQAGAWKYVPIGLLSILLFFIPIFGWALQWQISNRFVVQHLSIESRREMLVEFMNDTPLKSRMTSA